MLAPLIVTAMALPFGAALAQSNQVIVLQRSGTQKPAAGPAQNFTGKVEVTGRFQGMAPARVSGGTVSFEAGARTAWHTHPLGQTLIVTQGAGRVQHWGGPIQEIGVGDTVWIPPGVKHWHGASAASGMTHVAIAESLDGKTVDWMEHVSDQQFGR